MSTVRSYCSFCGRSDLEADVLIVGPVLAFICDTCVTDCADIITKKRADRKLEREIVRCAACSPAPIQFVASA